MISSLKAQLFIDKAKFTTTIIHLQLLLAVLGGGGGSGGQVTQNSNLDKELKDQSSQRQQYWIYFAECSMYLNFTLAAHLMYSSWNLETLYFTFGRGFYISS